MVPDERDSGGKDGSPPNRLGDHQTGLLPNLFVFAFETGVILVWGTPSTPTPRRSQYWVVAPRKGVTDSLGLGVLSRTRVHGRYGLDIWLFLCVLVVIIPPTRSLVSKFWQRPLNGFGRKEVLLQNTQRLRHRSEFNRDSK